MESEGHSGTRAVRGHPPYRAEHVGSLLRPQGLKDAFRRREAGTIGAEELRDAGERAIREAVAL